MTKVLHLIRHGESEANRAGIYQGQTYDTPLTKMGVRQAKAVAKILPGVKADVIYTSPLKRTYETAVEIKKVTDLKLKVEDKLLEISHGDWEGKKPEEFDEKEKLLLKKWRRNPVGVQMPNGENINDVVKRCCYFIDELPEGRYIVVAHDLVVRVIASMVLSHDFKYLWKYYLDNCGVTTVSFDPYRLVSLNQNFHLMGVKSVLNRQAL
jgi:phosphoserine phosphatase